MKAIVIHAARDLRIEEQQPLRPKTGQVGIAIGAGGICGSDLHYYNHGGFGAVRVKHPMVLGHEVAGTISSLGPDVEGLAVGDRVTARIDWARRLRLMRFHTTTHLLCHLVPQLVNGCSITPDYARLDFNMTDALDKEALTAGLARLVAAALPVTVGAITDEEFDAKPELVKSMSVQPPRGSGRIRTIRIGDAALIDLQPCGGTHVANTSEIGAVVVTKIEKKSATTRRVVLGFAS